jgi:hypothetical protein
MPRRKAFQSSLVGKDECDACATRSAARFSYSREYQMLTRTDALHEVSSRLLRMASNARLKHALEREPSQAPYGA